MGLVLTRTALEMSKIFSRIRSPLTWEGCRSGADWQTNVCPDDGEAPSPRYATCRPSIPFLKSGSIADGTPPRGLPATLRGQSACLTITL